MDFFKAALQELRDLHARLKADPQATVEHFKIAQPATSKAIAALQPEYDDDGNQINETIDDNARDLPASFLEMATVADGAELRWRYKLGDEEVVGHIAFPSLHKLQNSITLTFGEGAEEGGNVAPSATRLECVMPCARDGTVFTFDDDSYVVHEDLGLDYLYGKMMEALGLAGWETDDDDVVELAKRVRAMLPVPAEDFQPQPEPKPPSRSGRRLRVAARAQSKGKRTTKKTKKIEETSTTRTTPATKKAKKKDKTKKTTRKTSR